MEEEKELTIEDLLNLEISNQVVEEEVNDEEEAVKKPFSMDDFFDKNPNLKPIDPRVKESVIVRDNPSLLDPVELLTKVGKITEDTNYDATEEAIISEPGNPEESDFYIQTQNVTNKVDDIIKNPVKLPQATINVGEAKTIGADFEQVQEINIEATTDKINEELRNAPKIIELDEIAAQYAPNKVIDGEIISGIPDMFNVSVDPRGKATDEDTTKYYKVNESAYNYIKDSILTEGELGSYNTWEEFVGKADEVTQKILQQDPIIKKILAKAGFNLQNESYRKYVDMLNAAINENGLDSPEEIEALQREYDTWKDTRWNELIQSTEFKKRAQQYSFATKKVLEDLYKPYGRTQEGDLVEIDQQLREGEISESWWKLKDIGIGMTKGFGKKYKQLGLIADKPFAMLQQQAINTYNKAKELGLEDMTLQQIEDLYNTNPGEKYEAAIEDIYRDFNLGYGFKRDQMKPDDDYIGSRDKIKDRNLTLKEITEKSRENINKQEQERFKTGLSILEDERFQSLLNEIDPEESGFVDTVGQIVQQSNMLLTFAGEGIASLGKRSGSLPGVAAYGVGKLISTLGTLDIAANEFTSQIWGTFDKRIKDRKGENYQPTIDDFMAELDDPESVSILQNIITTGGIVALERLGIAKALGASKVGSKNIASILRGEYKTFLKTLPAFAYQREVAGITEYLTEGFQGYISDASVRLGSGESVSDSVLDAEFDKIGAKKGYQIGRFLPVVGKITQQSAIELNTAALKLSTNFDLGKLSKTFKQNELFFNKSIEKIQQDINSNKISEELGQQAIRNISNIRNAGLKIPDNIDGRSKNRLMNLLLRQQALQNKIKEVNNKDLSTNDIIELATVSNQIQNIVQRADSRENYINQVGNVLNIINNNENANVKIIRSKDDKAVKNQIDKLNSEGWKIAASKGLTTNYGTIFQKGDQQVILLNDKEILADGAINTAAHEFLHAVLWNTVKNSKGTAIALGNDLLAYLKDANPELIKNSIFAKRLQQYKDDTTVTNEQQAEEVLTLFSEAVLDGAIERSVFDGDIGQQIGNFFTRIFNSLVGREADIRFDTGRDVYNFIKGYNESIKKGKFTKAQDKLFEGRAKGDLIKREYTTKEMRDRDAAVEKSSKKLTELTVEYKDGDFDNVESLTTQYQKTGKDALKRWAAQRGVTINLGNPQVDQEVTSLLNKEFDSFTRNFDPSKAQASTYMENIAKRIGPAIVEEATRKGKQVSQDVLTEKGISPEVTVQPDIDQQQAPTDKRAKVFPNAVKAIADNITGEARADQKVLLKKDIEEAILRVGTNPKDIVKYIVKKTKTPAYRKLIKDKLGRFGSDQYIENVISLFDNNDFIKAIPVANIKRRFGKLFGIKQIDTVKTKKVEDGKTTYYDKQVYSIPAVDKTKLNRIKNYFLGGEKRSQSLFEIIGEGIAVESMSELRTDKEFMKNLQNRLDFKKSDLTADQFMDQVEFNLDKRNLEDTSFDQVKANKKYSTKIKQLTGFDKIDLKEGDYEANLKSITKALNKIQGVPTLPVTTNENLSFKAFQSRYRKFLSPEDKSIKPKDTVGFEYLLEKYGAIYNWDAIIPGQKTTYGQARNKMTIELIKSFPKKDRPMIRQLLLDMSTNQFAVGGTSKKAVEGGTTTGSRKGNLGLYGVESTFNEQVPEFKEDKNSTPKITRDKYTKTENGKSRRVDWNKVRGKNFIADQDRKLPAMFKLIDGLNKLKSNPNFSWYIKTLTGNVSNTQTHPFRFLMPLRNIEVDPKTNKPFDEKYVEEHTFVANNLGKLVEYGILTNQLPVVKDIIEASASQAAITEATDNKLKPLKLTSQMGPAYSKLIKSIIDGTKTAAYQGLASFIRYKDVIKGPGSIWNLKNKKTLADLMDLKLTGTNNNVDSRNDRTNIVNKITEEALTIPIEERLVQANKELYAANETNKKSSKKVKINKQQLFDLINANGTTEESIQAMSRADKAIQEGNKLDKPTKGISVFDFDDTLAVTNSQVIVTQNGKTFKITPAQFAESSQVLENEGATFNFDEFNKVVKGRKGPLADLALKRQEKFGSGDIFVLTARPQASAESIQKFLKGIGLDLPISNITGLENGTPEAKALWVVDKAADGYNDFYFADDALPNVQAVKNVLGQIDVKSKVQQAKASKKVDLNKNFNKILENQSGKEWFKTYSKARSQVEGKKANRFEFFIPPSAEDFLGLLYKMLPKGKNGDRALIWLQDHLIDPYHKGEQAVISSMISVANDFNALRKSIDNIPDNLNNQAGYSNFTYSQALRVYIWNMQGMDIPGISKRDLNKLTKLIENNADMKVFAEKIAFIQKDKGYPAPQDSWVAGSITQDIIRNIQKNYRKEALQEWQQNVDIIFSEENMYKLEALYGSNYITALKNILGRMKRGSNRSVSESKQVENVMDWINNSVGTTMFLNRKTGILQLLSSVNFINWSDNNIVAAGKAFANQPQYWKDVMYLLNSDYLLQRRNGMRINVAESEIAEASKKGGLKGAIAYLLNKGFVFTRIADSLAIATGGATFYRNRVNSLLKQVNIDTGKVYTKSEADAKAFNDFYKVAEESQQSSRADRISMQQASGLGRVVLNYANTPMQYARIIKRSTQDLLAGRGDWKKNVSRILYYGAAQNMIFNALQQALFTVLFDEEEEQDRTVSDKAENIGFGMLSSLLRGLGYGGALVDTLISMGREISIREDGLPSFSDEFAWNMFDFSPSVDTKVRKIRSIHKTFTYNRDQIKRRGFSLENPAYLAFAELISAGVNIPLDRALRMAMDLKQASDKDTAQWQKFALLIGYSSWSLNLPYWGTTTTLANEEREDEEIKIKYKKDATRLKAEGYKRRPMTKGVPPGKLNVDYIEVVRPTGDIEYWLMPKK